MVSALHTSRQLSNLRARNLSNRDNTFAGANDLGRIGEITSVKRIRARGIISPRDRVDVFKITAEPNFSLSGSSSLLKIQRGNLQLSVYAQVPGSGIQFLGSETFRAGTTRREAPGAENPLNQPLTIFLKFDRPTQNVRYNFQVTYVP